MKMRDILNLLESVNADHFNIITLYHITDNANFKLNPNFEPEDNSISINDRSGQKGIYLTPDVERWVNGHGYIRPFVVEIGADCSVVEGNQVGRYGGEVFVPADQFDKLKVNRVVPIDAICREEFGSHGWIERIHGSEFDTGQKITAKSGTYPFRDWRYSGDVRTMSPEQVRALKKHFAQGYKKRRRG